MNSNAKRILIVDDDPVLVDLVSMALQDQGYRTAAAYDGTAGLRRLVEVQPDLILLDVMMPGHNGWEVCRRIREMTDVPVIMLTAKRELSHRLRGLNLGADDYVPKPFDMEELILRVQAVLRRTQLAQTSVPVHYEDSFLVIDQARGLVVRCGEPVRITDKEMDLLALLVKRADEIVPREELLTTLWPDGNARADNHLKVLVSALRRRIEANPRAPRYIINRRGVGYGFQSHAHHANNRGSDAAQPVT